jgi:hypothetical protein
MPNWCANSLKLTAHTDDQLKQLNLLKEAIENDTNEHFGLFNFFVPCPKELNDTTKGYPPSPNLANNIEKYGYETWYEFNIDNWGTKWDAARIYSVNDTPDSVTLQFDTAWSPPEALYAKLYANGWLIEATWVECGADFIGAYINGDTHSESFNDGHINWDSDTCFEDECERVTTYFTNLGLDHEPAHTGG